MVKHMINRKLSKANLLKQLEAKQRLLDQLLAEQQQDTKLEFGWSGNLGHWYWDIPTNTVTFNPLKVTTLGYTLEEVPTPVGFEFFTSKLHPDDYEPCMENMRRHLRGETHVYEVEYRIRCKDGQYKWFYDRGAITKRGQKGKPLMLSGIVFDITDRKNKELKLEVEKKHLQQQATLDELTRALNYRGIIGELKRLLSSPKKESESLSILMIDVDDFKRVNDTYGHIVGDDILRDIAKIIQSNLRDSDRLGRYGGEEFLIVFPNTKLEDAYEIADRLRLKISQYRFIKEIPITVSGGVYELKGASVLDLIRQADINLYQAKRLGKNRIV